MCSLKISVSKVLKQSGIWYMLYVQFITKFELCKMDESNFVCWRSANCSKYSKCCCGKLYKHGNEQNYKNGPHTLTQKSELDWSQTTVVRETTKWNIVLLIAYT